jgi:hypothetical protein
LLLYPRHPRRRQPQVSGCRVQGRRSRSHATARRAALEAVAASRTIESEEDGRPLAYSRSPLGQCCYRFGTARARRAGLPRQSPARGAPDAAPQAHTGNMLAAPGASLADLKARMGHDSARAAMIYQHATAAADAAIADALDGLIAASGQASPVEPDAS